MELFRDDIRVGSRDDERSSEFDDSLNEWDTAPRPAAGRPAPERAAASTPRLVARLYAACDMPTRARLLACMLRPLGTLSLAAVATGAFANFVGRSRAGEISVSLDEVALFSNRQVLELARFVEQVSPQAMHQVSSLLSSNSMGFAAFSAAAAMLLYRRLRGTGQRRA